jgi:hypothetical protein
MDMVQLKTKIKEKLVKQAVDWEAARKTAKEEGAGLLDAGKTLASPLPHAWQQLGPNFKGENRVSDIQKIKNYFGDIRNPKMMPSAKAKSWEGLKSGVKGVGKTGLGLGMGGLAAWQLGPGAMEMAGQGASAAGNEIMDLYQGQDTVGLPEGLAGLTGGALGARVAGPWGALLGAGGGALAAHKAKGG